MFDFSLLPGTCTESSWQFSTIITGDRQIIPPTTTSCGTEDRLIRPGISGNSFANPDPLKVPQDTSFQSWVGRETLEIDQSSLLLFLRVEPLIHIHLQTAHRNSWLLSIFVQWGKMIGQRSPESSYLQSILFRRENRHRAIRMSEPGYSHSIMHDQYQQQYSGIPDQK